MRISPPPLHSLALVLACAAQACGDPATMPRPRTPAALLAPSPRVPSGRPQPLDSTITSLGPVPAARVAIGGAPASGTLTVGDTIALTVDAWAATGARIAPLTPRWSVSDRAVASIDSATGRLVARRDGSFSVGVYVTDTTAWLPLRVVTSQAPPPARAIAMQVVRFDLGLAPVTVSAGVPLVPGALRPGQEHMVRVFMGSVEQTVHVAGLPSLHPDGSLRAVLVQFALDPLLSIVANVPLPAQMEIGSPRSAAFTATMALAAPVPAAAGTPPGLPPAVILPTDPDYLIATQLVGPSVPRLAATKLGGTFARYESDFVTYSARLWASEGANWAGNFYDRALIYYAMWARTGDATYWARAGQIAHDYRTKYLEANAHSSSPHWAQLEGLEKHYLLTGDEQSRIAVGRTAAKLYGAFINSAYMSRVNGEGRIAARVLHSQLLGWRLATPTSSLAGNSVATWGRQVETSLAKIVAWQQPDGSFPADGQACGGQLNYMIGLQNDALIKTYEQYVPATTSRATMQDQIRGVVKSAVDYLWTTQWLPAKRAFQYVSVDCSSKNVGTTSPAPDLNNLISAGFAWVFSQTRDARYLAAADQIFIGGVTQAYLNGTKQFNENYTSSFRYFGYR